MPDRLFPESAETASFPNGSAEPFADTSDKVGAALRTWDTCRSISGSALGQLVEERLSTLEFGRLVGPRTTKGSTKHGVGSD